MGVCRFDEVTSTNDVAADMARLGAPHGFCVVAESQIAGRGRRGAKWFSPKGEGLYMSVIIKRDFELLPVAAAVALSNAVCALSGVMAYIKWPNDVTINKKKVAGVLIERFSTGDRGSFAVMGVGVNVNARSFPAELSATSIALERGEEADKEELRKLFLRELKRVSDGKRRSGLLEDYRDKCVSIGEKIIIEIDNARTEAVALGVMDDGRLIVETPHGKRTLTSGRALIG
ncbi:MAG: biotin--[acetyl-CoA-carboxylase] ligase [Clostridiales bacterium]|jgi:BirA family biotin operon repressor/biotin-[acetyl-CoA-carboxylase] ligase|nr:biotin--[acetyl-CoA-carboxylase] ligase [Clostridiales bacterium]